MDIDTSTLRTALTLYAPGVVFANVLLQQLGLPVPVLPTLLLAGSLATGMPRLAGQGRWSGWGLGWMLRGGGEGR